MSGLLAYPEWPCHCKPIIAAPSSQQTEDLMDSRSALASQVSEQAGSFHSLPCNAQNAAGCSPGMSEAVWFCIQQGGSHLHLTNHTSTAVRPTYCLGAFYRGIRVASCLTGMSSLLKYLPERRLASWLRIGSQLWP